MTASTLQELDITQHTPTTNRSFIGFELDKEYFNLANERIKEE